MPSKDPPATHPSSPRTSKLLIEEASALSGSPQEVDEGLVHLSVELAEQLLKQARARETRADETSREALSRILKSENNQRFSTALTDRIHRSHSPSRTVKVFKALAERSGCGPELPKMDRLQLRAGSVFGSLVPELTRKAVLARVRDEARPYLWDASPEKLRAHLAKRHRDKTAVNLNYLGEEVLGEAEAKTRVEAYCELVARPDLDAVSLKLSGIDSQIELLDSESTLTRLEERVATILDASERRPGGSPLIYFDMEAYRDLDITEQLITRLANNRRYTLIQFGLAVQTYLPESLELVRRLAEVSRARTERGGPPLRLRLVKGANLQVEEVDASTHRHSVPIFPSKSLVDAHFKRTLRSAIDQAASGNLHVGIASHNLFDIAYSILLKERAGAGQSLQFEMLEGMAGTLGEVVREITGSLLIYAPAVLQEHFSSAVSYLVRRLDENTAPENFLRAAPFMMPGDNSFETQAQRFRSAAKESWQDAPHTFRLQDRSAPRVAIELDEVLESASLDPQAFDNVADTDWTRAVNRQWVTEHVSRAKEFVPEVKPRLASTNLKPFKISQGFDPSRPDFSYPIHLVGAEDINAAIGMATEAASRWARTSVSERAKLLLKVAEEIERRRGEIIAAMVLEAGKRIQEADVEVSEAVDFAHYYARHALQLDEHDQARGVIVVTPPWNFPFAIPVGGILGALAAGNAVILKPAPETPWVAALAAEICFDCGVASDVFQFIPCEDEDASQLIEDPRINGVILTGATDTAKLFLRMRPSLTLFAETGGKNGAYLSAVSDREQAIQFIVRSAFSHAGQKCSALSVLIVQEEVFQDDDFKVQLVDAAQSLFVGPSWDARSIVTPLIHPPAGALLEVIEHGEKYGTWLLKPHIDENNPRLVSPGILWGVEPGSFPHLTEFFAPILCVLSATDFDEAMTLLNAPSYGLTAGLFSLVEEEQEMFVNRADAGNLYINRGQTGAVVGRQPFGGRKESCFGPGGKAGGPEYVRQFTIPSLAEMTEEDRWAARSRSYRDAFAEYFSRLHRGTEVLGEGNYYRFTPGKTAIVATETASDLDLRSALLAADLCQLPFPLLKLSRGVSELIKTAKQDGIERLRIVGTAPPELFEQAAEAGISMLADPFSDSGRQELHCYLQAQSISHSAHRHGNTSLAELSRMASALDYWHTEPKE